MAVELWVYGDESSIEPDNPYAAVSGFIASPGWWDKFNKAWAKVIHEADVDELHSADFFGRRSAYRHWSDARADAFLDALLVVLRNHRARITPLVAVLDTQAFFAYSWGERNFLTGANWNNVSKKFVTSGAPSRAYHLPFFVLVNLALNQTQAINAKVHFRMDEQRVVERGVQEIYNRIRTMDRIELARRDKLGDLHPGLSQEHGGIQAADLLAHISASTYAKRANLSRDRLRALKGLMTIWKNLDPGVLGERAMEHVLSENLSAGDRVLVRDFKSPAERQQAAKQQALDRQRPDRRNDLV